MPATLSQYILALIRDPQTYTADSLRIDTALCQTFYNQLQRSEAEVREYGVNLEWHPSRRVRPLNTIYTGSYAGTAVDLQTSTLARTFSYIGDFHTHPYVQKYGGGIAVGPSNGDWMQWFHDPPAQKPVAVHCVASGGTLFVLIFRNRPTGLPNFDNVTEDAGALNRTVRDLVMNDDQFATAIGEASTLAQQAGGRNDRQGIRDAWTGYRTAMNGRLPQVPQLHARDALAMNRELAERYGHELYTGPLGSASSLVTLRSNRVYGNWLTSKIWSSGTDTWFG